MRDNREQLLATMEGALSELESLTDTYGSDRASRPVGQRQRAERLENAARNADAALEALTAREAAVERVRVAAMDPRNIERAVPEYVAPSTSRRDPWSGLTADRALDESPTGYVARMHDAIGTMRGLSERGRNQLADAADRHGGPAARMLLARAHPAYATAFAKVVTNPERGMWTLTPQERDAFEQVEQARASLGTSTGTGGYLIPLSLDASYVSVTNVGIASALRRISRVETAISSPHRVLASAGINAEWLGEGSAVSDASPTFANVDVALHKAAAWVTASEELVADSGPNLMSALPGLFADARERLEGAALVSGSGSGAPYGVVTQVVAVTASRVAPTTGGAFGSVLDVYKVWDALTPRARQSTSLAWLAANPTISTIRRFDTYGGSAYIANLGERTPVSLLGAPLHETSAMDSATTTGSSVLLAGDFREYAIIDSAAGDSLEYVPHVVDGSGMPLYQRGWKLNHRVGAAVTSVDSFRLLRL